MLAPRAEPLAVTGAYRVNEKVLYETRHNDVMAASCDRISGEHERRERFPGQRRRSDLCVIVSALCLWQEKKRNASVKVPLAATAVDESKLENTIWLLK